MIYFLIAGMDGKDNNKICTILPLLLNKKIKKISYNFRSMKYYVTFAQEMFIRA